MKYALICPNEPVKNGYRIAQVEVETFPVGDPTHWIECGDDVVADVWYYDTTTNKPTKVPTVVPPTNGLKTP